MGKTLFVDYDGTLHNTEAKFAAKLDGVYGMTSQQVVAAYLHVHLEIVHRQFPEKHDDFFFHQKLICDHLNRPYDEGEARAMARIFEAANKERWTNPMFFPDTFEFLDRASEKYVLYLTTGDYARKKADALERASGRSYFEHAFDHTTLGVKGGSSYFENALMSTSTLPEEVVVVGDNLIQDVAAAKEAGIAAVWLNRWSVPRDGKSPVPDYEARDLLEALEYLDGL
jgi:HAD superfamily hydrolase (TIGR01549 family)